MAARLTLGRSLAVAGVLTAGAVAASAGVAYAGASPHPKPVHHTTHHTPPAHPKPVHPKPVHHKPGGHSSSAPATTTVTTRVPDARIRSRITLGHHSMIVDTLHTRGSSVEVTCFKVGAAVNGDRTWYKTVSPARGYIAGALVSRPATVVPRCTAKP